MSRRPALLSQGDIARTIRAAKQAGAGAIQVRPDGTLVIMIEAPAVAPEPEQPAVNEWDAT
jgi:hypothetical protein